LREEDLQHAESYRDRVSTVSKAGERKWVYASKPQGKWYHYRKILAYAYMLVFAIIPFIKVNGLPFFMINVPKGKFIIFSFIFWPQDFYIFAIAMITFIIFIVLFTVVFGRLFCGWVCPQTVFMEFIFRPIEWWIEGNPGQQKKLDTGAWDFTKMYKKALKHFIFFVISFLIANLFLSYILGIDELFHIIKEPIHDHVALLIGLVFFTYAFYAVFAVLRDLVCTTICPYGRLQGVMLDKDSMQIAYDYKRGEPRGKFKKHVDRTDGDCIHCLKCVEVCPTGIDIRDGLQMECIGCTACIDACDNMMTSINFKTGLIRYASENEISAGQKFHFNARMKAYTILLSILFTLMVILVVTRKTIDTHISRVKGQTYQELTDHKISNLFEAKIINKTKADVSVTLKLEDLSGDIKLIGAKQIVLKAEDINKITFFLEIPQSQLKHRSNKIYIGVYHGDEKIQTIKTTFLGPFI
jgi:cytochrome c oxidase accessory protein FixG